jgi:hypothetical protein
MQEGKIYKLGTDKGFATVKLYKIQTYPASGLPADYVFEYQPGSIKPIIHDHAEQLFGSKDRFPIPEALIPMIKQTYGLEEIN